MIARFIKFIGAKPFLLVYLLVLSVSGALLWRFIPVGEIVGGLVEISDGDAMSGIVSFAQWISAPDMLAKTLMFIPAVSMPLALVCALLFTGAFGSFAHGVAAAGGFPAKRGIGFRAGYTRFACVLILFFVTFAAVLSLIFVWTIAATPLAVIGEMTGRGVLGPAALNVTIAVTSFVIYVGLMFARVYPMSFIPAFFSGSRRPVRSAFGFASANFFHIARFFLLADAAQAGFWALNHYTDNNIGVMFADCAVSALFVLFLFYVLFEYYAADGNGYEEIDEAEADAPGEALTYGPVSEPASGAVSAPRPMALPESAYTGTSGRVAARAPAPRLRSAPRYALPGGETRGLAETGGAGAMERTAGNTHRPARGGDDGSRPRRGRNVRAGEPLSDVGGFEVVRKD